MAYRRRQADLQAAEGVTSGIDGDERSSTRDLPAPAAAHAVTQPRPSGEASSACVHLPFAGPPEHSGGGLSRYPGGGAAPVKRVKPVEASVTCRNSTGGTAGAGTNFHASALLCSPAWRSIFEL